ncbi:MAG TPA: histidinol-phosphate transaminase [bacterium]|nr:histidinol-phosphate transaminase [bacterium]
MFEDVVKKSILNIKPYVPGKPIEEVERELGIKNAVKLASNENPLGPSRAAVKAMRQKLDSINMYPDGSSYHLKRALGRHLKLKPGQLMLGNGSNELEQLIAEAFVRPGDEVLFSALSFVVYPIVTDLAGGTAVQVPHKEFGHDIKGFIKRLSGRTRLVFLCNPNNPTGTIFAKDELDALLKAVPKNVIVVLDEAYFEYCSDKEYPDGLKYIEKYPNLIVLRTFSKIYGLAGARVGYGAAHPEIVSIIERIRAPFNVNALAQAGALAALADKEHVRRSVRVNAEGKKYMYREFGRMRLEYVATQANFIFVKFNENSKVVFERLMKEGVIIRPQYDNYARITIGTMAENKKLVRALKKLFKNGGKK